MMMMRRSILAMGYNLRPCPRSGRMVLGRSTHPRPQSSAAASRPPRPPHPQPTLANWKMAPVSRTSFRTVEQFIPTASIPTDEEVSWDLPRQETSFEAFSVPQDPQNPEGPQYNWKEFLQHTDTDSILVLHRSQVRFEGYYQGHSAADQHIYMSASKSMTGLLVGILAQQGKLDPKLPVEHYLPQLAATSAYRGCSLQDLIDMRAGVYYTDDEARLYEVAIHWAEPKATDPPITMRDYFATYLQAPAKAPHGGTFWYFSPNTDLLGLVLEAATGEAFPSLLSRYLWQPLGSASDAQVTVDRGGKSRASGGLCSSLQDLARVGQLLLQNGRWDSRQVVPLEVLEDTWNNGDRQAWNDGAFAPLFAPVYQNMSYRNGWYVVHDAPRMIFAMGIHGQNLFVDPDNELVIAKFSSHNDENDVERVLTTHRGVAEIRRLLTETD
ncbi:unnamed protein product [Aspergillus niger]|nr:beta-lactamase/transpeptidase-like protein [Aspergillus niger ATCC 13496]SPB46685.1 unnamed protein product [Aspergillus niger]